MKRRIVSAFGIVAPMKGRFVGPVVAILSLMAVPASGQALFPRDAPKEPGARSWALERAKLPPFDQPRTPDGKPDLRGRWGGTPGGDDLEEHPYVDISSPPEESFVSEPPDGKIPYQPWALAVRAEHRAGLARGWPGEKGRLYADPQTYCLYTSRCQPESATSTPQARKPF